MKVLTVLAIAGVWIICACGSGSDCKNCDKNQPTDSLKTEEPVDELQEALKQETVSAPSKEQKENHEKIVKKYGEQWDFCKCVVANDSITDAFEKKLTPEQEERLMARWDYVDKKCKELTTMPNTTPEERALHDKRVMDCLKAKGLRK